EREAGDAGERHIADGRLDRQPAAIVSRKARDGRWLERGEKEVPAPDRKVDPVRIPRGELDVGEIDDDERRAGQDAGGKLDVDRAGRELEVPATRHPAGRDAEGRQVPGDGRLAGLRLD